MALEPLLIQIRVTWTQALSYETVTLITEKDDGDGDRQRTQCGDPGQRGESRPGRERVGWHEMPSWYSERCTT